MIKLVDYSAPAMPTDESVRRLTDRLTGWLRSPDDEDPFISDDSLATASGGQLDALASPPACASLVRDMDVTFADWIAANRPSRRVQWVVMPPCDHHNVVRQWAVENGHRLIQPPPRSRLIEHPGDDQKPFKIDFGDSIETTDDDENTELPPTLIVIPRLERWMLRHQDGLMLIRRLLTEVQRSPHRFVIGCSSWAWLFFETVLDGGQWMHHGLTMRPYDADDLATWLSTLTDDDSPSGPDDHFGADPAQPVRFRLTETGDDVFARSDDDLDNDFLATLAAQSDGIPWVAWELWRRSIRLGPGTPDDQADRGDEKFPNERTVWVTPMTKVPSPKRFDSAMLMVLHALLLHDGLTEDELGLTSPSVNLSAGLSALVAAEWVTHRQGRFQCRAAAYPQIIDRLRTAGYSVPPL